MKAFRLPNGNLLIPARAEDPKTGVIGDGMVEITPDSPEYLGWVPYAEDVKSSGGGKPES